MRFVPADSLPAQIREFIARHIPSVGQLEILCLLVENPNKNWSVKEVFRIIQSSEASVAACLRRLSNEGLLVLDFEGHIVSLPNNKT